ncbi:MAG: VWA domain-containing protein [Gammaproteobacteria bacterium]|nr:VWA domain-containing protein [Gammaproteobacteria bacterium]
MKLRRRGFEPISIAFLDVITCGFGAIILLLMIARFGDPPEPEPVDDPRIGEISALQRDLFRLRHEADTLAAEVAGRAAAITTAEQERARLREQTEQLLSRARGVRETARADAAVLGELKVAQQSLSEEMRRLYQQRDRARTDLVGGIPIDSEYIIFIIDTSGSMFRYAWPRVIDQIVQTLQVYPKVKGIQIMNDMGAYMFPGYRGQWIPDTPARRKAIIERLYTWNAFSNSSPVEGITTAIQTYYSPDRKISLYVYGDEFTGRSIREVVDYVASINRKNLAGDPLVRIHAIGFPVQFANPPHLQGTGIRFATLMRELTRRNGGTFVGLNAFR